MEKIAYISGGTFIYWSSIILALAVVTAIALYMAFYLAKGGKALLPMKYAEWLNNQPGDVDAALCEWNEVHNVPEELLTILETELQQDQGMV